MGRDWEDGANAASLCRTHQYIYLELYVGRRGVLNIRTARQIAPSLECNQEAEVFLLALLLSGSGTKGDDATI